MVIFVWDSFELLPQLQSQLQIFLCKPKSGDFQDDCAGVRHWVILVAARKVRKISYSIEVGTSEVRVLTIGLSPVIRLGLRNPGKKEKKDMVRRYVGYLPCLARKPRDHNDSPISN